MSTRTRVWFLTAFWVLVSATIAFAQEDDSSGPHSTEIPSPMGIHTWFIILVTGAFLAWSISYSLQLQKEALKRRSSIEGLLLRKNQYIDMIEDLQSRKEAGTISEGRYNRQFNNTKLRLAQVLKEIEFRRDASS